MNKLLKLSIIAPFISLGFMQSAQAQDITHCLKIIDNLERLTCYDKIASAQQKQPTLKNTSSKSDSINTMPKQLEEAQNNAKQPVTESKTQDDLLQQQAEEFGQRTTPSEQLQSIESHIVGQFKGWQKGAIIQLENGQQWKVISESKGYAKLQSPKATISRGILGSFDMRIEGFRTKAKVKRIK
ncbi:hypothetical protein [Aliikangiella maris]|uniref:Uncharacterized protein n=2 Tax=Aliikangiella maris TaxID=3162458 RepID=A0ABV3MSH2_9GAMM